ncbi:hypothetical protein U4E84_13740 [Halorubrum sp. AD140]|uniref:hypothetical protein n=1 Tax=Halorubrum sp. AD140 TaxID=3050073 RepID=UPI002ACD0238|nr:hypothetical protein [Halorubrum sp. AD140]MDZ5812407.1 hypothetical protein [Halorubrum sp. AD140]
MASKQPIHSGGAQTKEFEINLVAAGLHNPGDPEVAEAVVSTDANATLRVEISASDRDDWQLDVRRVDGSLDIIRSFHDGVSVHDDVIPQWIEHVVDVVGERLERSR